VRVQRLDEGRCLQIMHLGSFDDEAPTLARLHDEIMPARGLTWNGRHHEIYLSDARRVAPERRRTVLRQPVAPIDARAPRRR
ncbi:GyrI-like domain-containing protein, partial [Microbacterium sp.]|uniref:GyrI-like domain-containing protein n=1 Tax=Microbacterium sp. TaxID=51671 RepID=UPI003A8615A9